MSKQANFMTQIQILKFHQILLMKNNSNNNTKENNKEHFSLQKIIN